MFDLAEMRVFGVVFNTAPFSYHRMQKGRNGTLSAFLFHYSQNQRLWFMNSK